MAFDHMFDHFAKNSLISYPGVAQLVGRLIWEFDRVETACHNLNRKTC